MTDRLVLAEWVLERFVEMWSRFPAPHDVQYAQRLLADWKRTCTTDGAG